MRLKTTYEHRTVIYIPLPRGYEVLDELAQLTKAAGGCTGYDATGFYLDGGEWKTEVIRHVEVWYRGDNTDVQEAVRCLVQALLTAGESSVLVVQDGEAQLWESD